MDLHNLYDANIIADLMRPRHPHAHPHDGYGIITQRSCEKSRLLFLLFSQIIQPNTERTPRLIVSTLVRIRAAAAVAFTSDHAIMKAQTHSSSTPGTEDPDDGIQNRINRKQDKEE